MEKKTVLVAGLGRFGSAMCKRLSELEQSVIAVDTDKNLVEDMADFADISAQLDVTDADALEKVGAGDADVAIVAIGGDFGAEVLAVVLLKTLEIPYIIARADTSLHAKVLEKVGADYVVFPERELGVLIADGIVHPATRHFSKVGDQFMGEISPLPEMIGKSLAELSFRKTYNAAVVMVEENGGWKFPHPDEPITAENKLVVVGNADDLEIRAEVRRRTGA